MPLSTQPPAFSLYDILDQAVDLLEKMEQYHTAAQYNPDPVLNSTIDPIYKRTFQEFDHAVDLLTYWIAEIEDQYQREVPIQESSNEVKEDMSMSM